MSTNKFIIKINPADLVPRSTARLYYYAAFWIAAIQMAAIGILWKYIPRVVPIFFTEPWGEARLAAKTYLFLLPGLTILSIIVNLIMGQRAKEESSLMSYVLAVSSLVVAVMFSISIWGILQSII